MTFNLSAESVLALAQTADPAPTFVAHPSALWVLGGHGSQLAAMEPGFTGVDIGKPVEVPLDELELHHHEP